LEEMQKLREIIDQKVNEITFWDRIQGLTTVKRL
jgi:hypothetical protein